MSRHEQSHVRVLDRALERLAFAEDIDSDDQYRILASAGCSPIEIDTDEFVVTIAIARGIVPMV